METAQELSQNIGQLDRAQFRTAHNDSVYTQAVFAQFEAPALAYSPCWAILDPGMTVEAHQHPIAEFYVFVNGSGSMRLGSQRFAVSNGMAVNIPPDVEHEVSNSPTAVEPLIWVSIGLKTQAQLKQEETHP